MFYRSFRERQIIESHEYSIWSLLSEFFNIGPCHFIFSTDYGVGDIGGALGLWLGATVITAYELLIVLLPEHWMLKKRVMFSFDT